MNDSEKHVTIVKPRNTWDILTIRDLWEYRDMLLYLVLRDIKARYTQSVLGIGWAVLQPLFLMIVFTVIFGKLVKISEKNMDKERASIYLEKLGDVASDKIRIDSRMLWIIYQRELGNFDKIIDEIESMLGLSEFEKEYMKLELELGKVRRTLK